MAEEKIDESGKELAEAMNNEFAIEPEKVEVPVGEPKADDKVTPPVEPAKEEPKKDGEPKPTGEEKKPTEGAEEIKDPKTPVTPAPPEEPVAPQPLTKEDVADVISKIREEEGSSAKVIETATDEVMKAYYPDGVSNVLIDEKSGKELRTPQDVVDASDGTMTIEQANSWLTNEQYKLDSSITKIKEDAQNIAKETVKFKTGVADVLTRYEPVFKAYPGVQKKVWDQFSKMVKADEAKGVILSAPDIGEFYDTVLEPYQKAYEYSQKNPGAAAPVPAAAPASPAKPGADDRLDEGGDGGQTPVDDPEDFAQQVTKELAKGL